MVSVSHVGQLVGLVFDSTHGMVRGWAVRLRASISGQTPVNHTSSTLTTSIISLKVSFERTRRIAELFALPGS